MFKILVCTTSLILVFELLSEISGVQVNSQKSISAPNEVVNPRSDAHLIASENDSCQKFDFRWIELFNMRFSSKIRRADIFMDPASFNESNLRTLFEYMSSANPEPDVLIVKVKTDWKQIEPASRDCPGSGDSNMPERPDKYDHLQAILQRRGRSEYFIYSPRPKVRESEFIKVEIRSAQGEN